MSPKPVLRLLDGGTAAASTDLTDSELADSALADDGLAEYERVDEDWADEELASSELASLKADIEAVLLVAEEPVPTKTLAAVTESDPASVQHVCQVLAEEYRLAGRGFEITNVAGGMRLQTTTATTATVKRFVAGSNSARLSAAALETLAVVAYKQPVSRSQITAIRGVNADAVVRSLCERGYLVEQGRDPGPGNAALLRTTDKFLQRLGLASLDALPSLADMELDPELLNRLDGTSGP